MIKPKRALLSVSNKTGLVALARTLLQQDVALVSSGGTAKALESEGIPVTAVAAVTGAPEMLDGRVKTLHPKVFGGLLARDTAAHRSDLEEQGIDFFDLVVVNLYPFEQTVAAGAAFADVIENIDIGGPSLIRAAAKNHERVAVLVSPNDYGAFIEQLQQGGTDAAQRQALAAKAFAHTAAYDAAISNYFDSARADQLPTEQKLGEVVTLQLRKAQHLRYGENPHQAAAYYAITGASDAEPQLRYEQTQGKELSYNNLMDVDAAWNLAAELPDTGVAIIKHTNPCGAASVNGAAAEAFRRALAGDPVSAFGGIVACNSQVSEEMAQELKKLFVEVVVAPDYEEGALRILSKKRKLRVLRMREGEGPALGQLAWRGALGGLLLQQADGPVESVYEGAVPTERKPSDAELAELHFAWTICKHVKSNAIVFTKDRQLVGVGAGQMSRVDSVKLAKQKAVLPLAGSVVASDAFFPFRDGLDECAAAGAVAVVQPGGSVRDDEVVLAANEHKMAMVFTGHRHFRH